MPRTLRKTSLGLLLSIGTLLALFGVVEIGWRIAESRTLPAGELWATYDPELGYRNNPDFADHNALGMRDGPVGPPGKAFRLLALGDSVLYYGDSAEDTFPGRLEAELAEAGLARRVEVLNAGTKGYTTYQELLWLEKYGLALEPDVVLVGFVLNDLHRFLHRFRVKDDRIVGHNYEFTDEAVGGVDSLLYRTLRKSRFLVWLRRKVGEMGRTVELEVGDGYAFEARPDFNTAWREESWKEVEPLFARIRELGREHGFAVAIVCFPYAQQYEAKYLERDRDHVLFPQARLAELCRRLDIPLFDAYPELEPERDLLPDGVHLTAEGRARIAERLAEFLSTAGLLPR